MSLRQSICLEFYLLGRTEDLLCLLGALDALNRGRVYFAIELMDCGPGRRLRWCLVCRREAF
jgi:hypothetical protein